MAMTRKTARCDVDWFIAYIAGGVGVVIGWVVRARLVEHNRRSRGDDDE